MDRETLAEQWDRNNHRYQWIIDVREQLEKHTNLSDPIPRRKVNLQEFLTRYKATISRQLHESGETDNTTDTQEEDE